MVTQTRRVCSQFLSTEFHCTGNLVFLAHYRNHSVKECFANSFELFRSIIVRPCTVSNSTVAFADSRFRWNNHYRYKSRLSMIA